MLAAVALLSVLLVQDTVRAGLPADSYADAATAELVSRARAARDRNERLVTSYRASVSQRIGVGVRAVGRDRMLFRQELAANIEWYRDRPSRIEVVGARQGVPIALRGDQVPEDLQSGLRELVINPAEDVLRFAGLGEDDEGFIYPLREGGEHDYRFAMGDSTVIALPSGKRIRLLELKVIPRRSDWRLMSGALWFDGDTHGLVRMIFRPARPFEFRRDISAEDREDVPRWVNPKGEVKYVTLEYGLYEERWWMLRYAAIDAVGTMGSWLNMPIRMEQVYTDYEVEGGTPPDPASTFRPAGTRRQPDTTAAGIPIDSATRRAHADSVRRVVRECIDEARDDRSMRSEEGRRAYRQKVADCRHRFTDDSVLVVAVPDDTLQLINSPALGEPILSMGDLISDDELRGLAASIGRLPGPPWAARLELPYGATELLRHARFNRIEAVSLGVAARADFGKLAVDGRARIGVADGWLNAEVGVSTGSTIGDHSRIAVYRRLAAANPETRPFGVMNSLAGLFTHRDDGQFFRTEGVEATQTVGAGWLESRVYYERQRVARVETDFSIRHLLGSEAAYQPNIVADRADQFGGSLRARGSRALSRQVGVSGEAFVEGATGDYKFGRGSVTLRSWVTPRGPLAFGASLSAGTTEGTSPVQSWFYLGGPVTLRGYDGGVMAGPSFWTGRAEVANSFPAVRLSLFSDIGWAGQRAEFWSGRPLLSAGVGASFLDGLIRADLARGLRSPTGWRFDLTWTVFFRAGSLAHDRCPAAARCRLPSARGVLGFRGPLPSERSMIRLFLAASAFGVAAPLLAQSRPSLSETTRAFVSVDAPVVALTRVRVVDGTGAPAATDQTVLIADGRISAVGPSGSVTIPTGARVLDLAGHTVIPGLVGMHNHTFYTTSAGRRAQLSVSAPRLYLASGVTTIRTTGSIVPYAEISLKRQIEAGEVPGPRMHVSGPYITGPDQVVERKHITTPEQAKRVVDYWADEGATWFKVYTEISRENLRAVAQAAHARGVKVTGHLCSVGYKEAVEAGIDALEHGLLANFEYDPAKQPDRCPGRNVALMGDFDPQGPAAQATFKALIDKAVPMTSTLAVMEISVPSRPPLEQRVLDAMSPDVKREYLDARERIAKQPGQGRTEASLRKAMAYEVAFVNAGGLLAAGVDPTGNGGALPGYGDQRNYELLVEAGFKPVDAIRIMSANGAKVLGVDAELGTIARGKVADLVVIRGDPTADPTAIRRVVTVFKDGVGYDSAKLIESVNGLVGIR